MLCSGTVLSSCLRDLDNIAARETQASGKPQPTAVVYIPIWHEGVTQLIADVTNRDSGTPQVQHVAAGILIPDILCALIPPSAA